MQNPHPLCLRFSTPLWPHFQVRSPSAIMKVVYGKSVEGLSLTPVYLHHGSNLRITPCSNANRLNKPQVFVAAMFENVHIWASKSQLPWRLVFGTDTVISLPTGQVYQLAQELIKLMNSSLPMHSVLLVVLQITALIKDRIQSCQVVGVNCLKFKELTRLTPPNFFFSVKSEQNYFEIVRNEAHCVVTWWVIIINNNLIIII